MSAQLTAPMERQELDATDTLTGRYTKLVGWILNWQPDYDNEPDLIEDLRDHAARMRRGDSSRLPELRYVLLPTGALNEIAFLRSLHSGS